MRLWILAVAFAGCVDTTGSALVTFQAVAEGGSAEGDTGLGYHLILSKATLHIGGVYLKLSPPRPGAQAQDCVQTGSAQFYSGQVREGLDVDALSSAMQPFPLEGDGTADSSPVGELWLISQGLVIEAETDNVPIAQIAGTASKARTSYPFTASITISQANRGESSSDPAQPSAFPICGRRIVTPIGAGFTPAQDGTLLVHVEPLAWFDNVEFAEVPADPNVPGSFKFPDTNTDQQSKNLFTKGVHSTAAYTLTFTPR